MSPRSWTPAVSFISRDWETGACIEQLGWGEGEGWQGGSTSGDLNHFWNKTFSENGKATLSPCSYPQDNEPTFRILLLLLRNPHFLKNISEPQSPSLFPFFQRDLESSRAQSHSSTGWFP